jgi:lysosomal alpha-glucosidase
VISRSSFPGQGHYGGSWTGDVFSTWDDLQQSIPQILNYGLFGIPMVGADICGFNGNTTKDLCKRWQQLGAFYPFMRNHNTDDGIPQDPASLGQEVIDATKETLRTRYYLLPYIYSLFVHAHRTGEPVARPMFYEFPKDSNTFKMQSQFMLGHSILVAPILTPEFTDTTLDMYLPSGYWYSYYFTNISTDSVGEGYAAKVPNNSIPIFVRGGSIIVGQQPELTTTESRKNKFEIKVYLSKEGNASGIFYWDDGVSNSPYVTGTYNQLNMTASNNDLRVTADRYGYYDSPMILGSIQVRGIRGKVDSVVLDNIDFKFSYNSEHKILDLDNLNLSMKDGFSMKWKTVPF